MLVHFGFFSYKVCFAVVPAMLGLEPRAATLCMLASAV
jgi:hypothetical protein